MQENKFELKMEKIKLENDVDKLMHIKNLKSLLHILVVIVKS
jgi:hypothetical protein